MPARAVQDAVQAKLDERFGKAKWMSERGRRHDVLDRELAKQKKLDAREVERVAADAARSVPHVAAGVHARAAHGRTRHGRLGRPPRAERVQSDARRDLVIILEPYWIYGASGTTHGTPYNYDTHVPVISWGGDQGGQIQPAGLAQRYRPDAGHHAGCRDPQRSSGRVLDEMLIP